MKSPFKWVVNGCLKCLEWRMNASFTSTIVSFARKPIALENAESVYRSTHCELNIGRMWKWLAFHRPVMPHSVHSMHRVQFIPPVKIDKLNMQNSHA